MAKKSGRSESKTGQLPPIDTRFKPGVSGNPKGRPRIPQHEKDAKKLLLEANERLVKKLVENGTYETVMQVAIQKATEQGVIKPIELLHHYTIGKPVDRTDLKKESENVPLNKWLFGHMPKGVQWEVYESNKRFLIGNIGRQWGKSETVQMRLAKRAYEKQGVYWWVSPTYAQAKVIFRRFIKNFKNIIEGINKAELLITLKNSSQIFFKSEEKPDNLRGETLQGAVLDEYAMFSMDTWTEIIRPMLGTTEGWVDFISTPKGKNHFWKLYNEAIKDPENWDVFQFPSNTSTFFSKSEFEAAKKTLPALIFEQEYLAKFIDDNTGIFRGIRECINGTSWNPDNPRIKEVRKTDSYVMGLDIAKHQDFTVITVFNAYSGELVYYDRFNQMNYSFITEKVYNIGKYYNNCLCVMDATGIGDALLEQLSLKECYVLPVKFTNEIKQNLIYCLALAIENREISYPEIPELIDELGNYAMKMLPSGRISFNAPEGQHDDIVISMALAVSRMRDNSVKVEDLIIGD